jgi:hypothetical protein
MSDAPQQLGAVEAILTERDALHGWLARLDSSGSSTPQAVRTRVRVDYERRLEAVTERLRAHADTIASRLAADRAEHDDLAARARISRDALAEAELRHAVGEFDSARFEQERSRHTGDLESFELSLNAVAERIATLEDVEALVSRGPVPPETTAPEAAVPAAPESPVSDPVGSPAPAGDPVIDMTGLDPDEESGILSIFEPVEEAPVETVPPGQPAAAPGSAGFGPLSFTPSDGPPPRAVPPGAPPLGMPEADQKPRFVRPSADRGSELAEADVARSTDRERVDLGTVEVEPDPVLPEPSSDTVPRTLRCGECGAMNRSLEWYCEKCGAELTQTP